MSLPAAFAVREGDTIEENGATSEDRATAPLMNADFNLLSLCILSHFFLKFLPIICLIDYYTRFGEKRGYKTVTQILQSGKNTLFAAKFGIVRKK